MTDAPLLFLDANTLASSLARTLVLTGASADGLGWTWSQHVETEADGHARGAMPTSVVRKKHLRVNLSPTARSTRGLVTKTIGDRTVLADAITAGARYLITTDVDDFAFVDLAKHEMSAVNPDYFMALRYSEQAYRKALAVIAGSQKNPPRTEAELHRILGRRHPRLTGRFADAYETIPVEADRDQPSVVFRGVACIRCAALVDGKEGLKIGLCNEHLAAAGVQAG